MDFDFMTIKLFINTEEERLKPFALNMQQFKEDILCFVNIKWARFIIGYLFTLFPNQN